MVKILLKSIIIQQSDFRTEVQVSGSVRNFTNNRWLKISFKHYSVMCVITPSKTDELHLR